MTCGLLAAMSVGATLALLPRFDPAEALRMIAAERVTIFEGVPTMYVAMLAAADRYEIDVSSLRVCVSWGAAMPVEVLRAFEDRFGCAVSDQIRPASAVGMRVELRWPLPTILNAAQSRESSPSLRQRAITTLSRWAAAVSRLSTAASNCRSTALSR